jgi:ABC-2 type transport system permease protein
MSWVAIARRDFQNARRSRILALVVGLFVALVGLLMLTGSTGGETPAEDALWTLHGIALFLMPIVMLVVAYLSVAGERETGRIQYLLGLPNRRWEVVLGKFVSRSLVAVLAVGLSMAVGLGIMFVRFDTVPVADAAGLAVFMLFLATVYIGLAVGISALTATRARAMAGAIGVYVFFTVYWIVPTVNPQDSVSYVVEELLGLGPKEDLYEFVLLLSPSFAYDRLTNGLLFERAQDGSELVDPGAPFYLQPEFMPVILLGWLALALGVGYWRFRDAELG